MDIVVTARRPLTLVFNRNVQETAVLVAVAPTVAVTRATRHRVFVRRTTVLPRAAMVVASADTDRRAVAAVAVVAVAVASVEAAAAVVAAMVEVVAAVVAAAVAAVAVEVAAASVDAGSFFTICFIVYF